MLNVQPIVIRCDVFCIVCSFVLDVDDGSIVKYWSSYSFLCCGSHCFCCIWSSITFSFECFSFCVVIVLIVFCMYCIVCIVLNVCIVYGRG